MNLNSAVYSFAHLTHSLADSDLDRPWDWKDYKEGVRFAFFRVYEDLRNLAVYLARHRSSSGLMLTSACRILGQYQMAYRDLQAVTLGINNTAALSVPAEGEWSMWEALTHIVRAERTFFAINHYAIEGTRTQDQRPEEMSDEAWDEFWSGDQFDQVRASGDIKELLAYYDTLNRRIVSEFVQIEESELNIPVVFWESAPMTLQFRLHRFDSHLRQHTIQIEKILPAIGCNMNEVKRLLRLIYNALAEVESLCFGLVDFGRVEQSELAGQIAARTIDVANVLQLEQHE